MCDFEHCYFKPDNEYTCLTTPYPQELTVGTVYKCRRSVSGMLWLVRDNGCDLSTTGSIVNYSDFKEC